MRLIPAHIRLTVILPLLMMSALLTSCGGTDDPVDETIAESQPPLGDNTPVTDEQPPVEEEPPVANDPPVDDELPVEEPPVVVDPPVDEDDPVDDPVEPGSAIGLYDATLVEGTNPLEFVIALHPASETTVQVDYATEDGSAIAGTDYTATRGTIEFAPGDVRKLVAVPLLNNPAASTSSSKTFQLVLTHAENAVLEDDSAVGTIIDRDAMTTDMTFDHQWEQIGPFTNADKCGTSCHKSSSTRMIVDGEDVSPGTQWKHSVMANSFSDPYWQAAVEDEVDSFPQLSGLVEDTCTRCHAPMGHTHAHSASSGLDAEGYYRIDTARSEMHAREGVSCTLCHQIDDGNLGTEASFSGHYTIPTDPTATGYKEIVGPYGSPVGSNMNMQTGHRPVEGSYISASAICATCHTLYTPVLDAETGTPTGNRFLEQGPFLEWQNSVYATGQTEEAQCQDCHMPEPADGYSTPVSLLPVNSPERTPYGQHTLLGGNTHLLEILRDYRDELGLANATSDSGFDKQITQTRNFLQSAATLELSPLTVDDNDLRFEVQVINHSGHKMPTSFPSRRMWLEVIVRDAAGTMVFASGRPDDRGYLSTDAHRLKADCLSAHKLEGFDSSPCYEPHHDVISDPAEVAIYETVLANSASQITHTLLQAAGYLKDNRIPPAGFTRANATSIEPQTLPTGVDNDADFNCADSSEGCGADSVHYTVDTQGHSGPFSVQTRLLYQSIQPGFVDGMHNTGERVNRFKVMYDAVPPPIEVLAEASASS